MLTFASTERVHCLIRHFGHRQRTSSMPVPITLTHGQHIIAHLIIGLLLYSEAGIAGSLYRSPATGHCVDDGGADDVATLTQLATGCPTCYFNH